MNLKNVFIGHTIGIAFGIMAFVLVMAGGAGATKFIRTDATGGDCTSFGTWNLTKKTCTMTSDLIETIQIDSNGTTLNGDGYSTSGSYIDNGIYLAGRSGVTIKNLNVRQFSTGIYLFNSNNNYLIGNNVSNNGNYGISLSSSSNNTISGNNASNNNWIGISLSSSSNNNTLSGNNANSNFGYYDCTGIRLSSSSNNTLSGNNASNNIGTGISLFSSSNNMLSGNNANSNFGEEYRIGIMFFSSNNNTLSGNNVSNNGFGILYSYSNNSMLSGNTANSNNAYGIVMDSSNNNMLSSNNFSNNKEYGIVMGSSNNNRFYNNFFNNTNNFVFYDSGINTWNITRQSGTNIIGSSYLGGNFWAYPNGTGFSQKCADVDKDGICDTQYSLNSNNIDYLPLAKYTTTTRVTIISPNGGETWVRGSKHTIKWTYVGTPGSSVKIDLMKGGVLNRIINSSTSTGISGSGSYNWLINSTQTLGYNYKVRVTSTTNSAYTDTSNNNFTIIVPCNKSTIYGYSFNDTNSNKKKDSGEVGLSNRTINLKGYDTCTRILVSKTITTNATGYFAFKSINPGSYMLSEDYILGWLPTTDTAYTLSISSVSVTIRKNFGNKKFI